MSEEENQGNGMKKLLQSWKLEMLVDRLEDYGFGLYSLENIEENYLATIFPEKKFYGPVKRFLSSHSNWIKSVITTSVTNSAPPISSPSDSGSDSTDDTGGEFNLEKVLKTTTEGVNIMAYYEKNKTFADHGHRQELVNLIAYYLVDNKFKMSVPHFKEVANQVGMLFAYEDKDVYYGLKNGKHTGLVSIAYYNRLAARKKETAKKQDKEKKRHLSPDPPDSEINTSVMNDEIQNAIEWMKAHNPIDDDDEDADECLLENWNYCFHYRTATIEKAKNVDDILNEWPALNNNYGFSLIEADIERSFGNNAATLLNNWTLFANHNLNVLRKVVTDPFVKESLGALSDETSETNFHNIEMVLAMQHLMAPTTVTLENKKKFRATIDKAKAWLIKLVDGPTEMQNHLQYLIKDRQLKKLKVYPVIFAVGENKNSITEFVVAFAGLTYFFETIIEAIDAAFKCHLFFKTPFSPEHKRFWTLINGLFYKVECDLEMSPAISSVLKSFK